LTISTVSGAAGLQPVEIKSGQTLPPSAFIALQRWITLAGSSACDPLLIYGGAEPLTHAGIRALPWTFSPPDFLRILSSMIENFLNH
jgi:hypothetical protein